MKIRFSYKDSLLSKLCRIAVYALVVSIVIGIVAARSVYGNVKESAFAVGDQLEKLGDLTLQSNRLRINGELIHVASAQVDQPIGQILDRFENECREHSGNLAEEFERMRAKSPGIAVPDVSKGPLGLGILRAEREKSGLVACLSQEGEGGFAGLSRRVKKFISSGDLSDIGNLRYVMANRTATGGTHLVAVWTEGHFLIGRIFPKEGDAPGSDVPNAVRPGAATRLLTVSVDGAPYGVRVYDASESAEIVLKNFDDKMPGLGWTSIPALQAGTSSGRGFSRGDEDLLVFANKEGDSTLVSLVTSKGR